ncbi:MAG: ATP-binding protein [Candidatus Binatia bacterium]|nr:ATP-binding protein [Candidatus Binatia bacterium]
MSSPIQPAAFEAAMSEQAHETTARALLWVGVIYLGLALVNFFLPPDDLDSSFVLPSLVVGAIFLGLGRWVRGGKGGREVRALFLAGLVGLSFSAAVVEVSANASSFYVLLSSMVGIGCLSFDLRAMSLLTLIAWVFGWLTIEFRLPPDTGSNLVPQLLGTGALAILLTWIRRSTLTDAVQSIHELELRIQGERIVLDGALDAVVIADDMGNIVEWNDQAHAIFGWSREEVVGRRLADTIIPARYREAHGAGMARLRSGSAPRVVGSRIEIEALHQTGREFPIELTITRSSLSASVQFTAFLRDISERRSAERTQVRAREAAEEADRLKSEFLATISHEIRTPLNGIFGMTEMALEATDDGERRDFLNRSQSCAETLIALVGDVLDFSRFESGQIELEKISFDIRRLAEGVIDTFAVQASAKGVELILAANADVPQFIVGDPTRFRQVLLNLIGNAVKFTHSGHVALDIKVSDATGADDSARLRVSVEDSGIGMAKEDMGIIFDVFRQADASTTRQFGGVGLGLAISQRLVVMMGAEIQVKSVLGKGSRFSFELPLVEGDAEIAMDLEVPSAGRLVLWEKPGRLALHLRGLFESWGCEVTLADSFSDVCRILASADVPYDLLVLRADPSLVTEEIEQVLRLAGEAKTAVLATCPIGEARSVRERFPDIGRLVTRPGNEQDLRQAARSAVEAQAGLDLP